MGIGAPSVIVVNDSGHVTGGAGAVALAEAGELHRRGVRVALLCAVGPVAPELVDAGLPAICLEQHEIATDPNRLRAIGQGLWNTKAASALGGLLAGMPTGETVIHIHGWTKALSSSVVRAAARRAPVVLSLHDYFTACPTGGFFDFNAACHCPEVAMSAGCLLRACDRRGYGQKVYRVARQVVQRGFGGIPGLVTDFIYPSDFSLARLRRYLPAGASYHGLPNPVVGDRHPPADVAKASAFLWVGRLSPEKGGELFAEAARMAGVPTVFAGSGESADAIRAANPDAQLVGWLDVGQLDTRFRAARALVFPSLLWETFGLTVAEAASRGVPAIVSDGCAARDLIVDGETGLLFRNGDAEDLARALRRLDRDPELAARLGLAAWERYWAAPLDLGRHVDGLLSIYRKVLDGRANPPPHLPAALSARPEIS